MLHGRRLALGGVPQALLFNVKIMTAHPIRRRIRAVAESSPRMDRLKALKASRFECNTDARSLRCGSRPGWHRILQKGREPAFHRLHAGWI